MNMDKKVATRKSYGEALEQLGKELSLGMIGTVDKQMKKEEVEKASKEFEEMKSKYLRMVLTHLVPLHKPL